MNQCQIIVFLILKSDIIQNSRIELRGIIMPVPSTQIKITFIIILPVSLVQLCLFFFGGGGGGGVRGGANGMFPPPLFLRP